MQAALESGCRGIVCAASDVHEAKQYGPRLTAVVPGHPPAGTPTHDQARAATPEEAIGAGADVLVLGRAVTHADDPGRRGGRGGRRHRARRLSNGLGSRACRSLLP